MLKTALLASLFADFIIVSTSNAMKIPDNVEEITEMIRTQKTRQFMAQRSSGKAKTDANNALTTFNLLEAEVTVANANFDRCHRRTTNMLAKATVEYEVAVRILERVERYYKTIAKKVAPLERRCARGSGLRSLFARKSRDCQIKYNSLSYGINFEGRRRKLAEAKVKSTEAKVKQFRKANAACDDDLSDLYTRFGTAKQESILMTAKAEQEAAKLEKIRSFLKELEAKLLELESKNG
ncbi:unnamed protein product [Owenia fusiformis]|uniref:Uncharacterized protein n=1 Tax=Owenia fusiformis TaxID=6347 RepID=A0A8J1TYL2_OWEFU|nr:unnamed protein product [Owenia fusiformis]